MLKQKPGESILKRYKEHFPAANRCILYLQILLYSSIQEEQHLISHAFKNTLGQIRHGNPTAWHWRLLEKKPMK